MVTGPGSSAAKSRFSGKRDLLRQVQTLPLTLQLTGREWHNVDLSRVERFVFVCKGNICRSAFAAARAASLGLPTTSAGLEARGGDPANDTACRHAKIRGLDLEAHRTTSFSSVRLQPSDLLLCMEPPQARAISQLADTAGAQVTLLGLWSRPIQPWLFDPYNLPDERWLLCLDKIDDGLIHLAALWHATRRRHLLTPADRAQRAILVPSAFSMGGLGVIRSLGRAGYRVHAAAPSPDAFGFRSRYASATVVHPSLGSAEFPEWLHRYVAQHAISMVAPTGGGFAPSPNNVFAEYRHLFPTSPNLDVIARGASKSAQFARVAQVSPVNCPPFLLVNLDHEPPSAASLATLGTPLFVKLDAAESRDGAGDRVLRIRNADAARLALIETAAHYRRAVVQGYVPGCGVGAFLLRWNGRIIARMMHMRLHEMPHTGGASSFRTSWWHPAIIADAESKLAAMDWQGVAMVEYRWDEKTDLFALMEMNLRFWGSLHLALFAGVDFPTLVADAFFGSVPESCVEAQLGVRVRNTVPYEMGYLVSLFRDPCVAVSRKINAAAEAVLLSLDPRVKNDLLFPGDRMLFLHRMIEMARGRKS